MENNQSKQPRRGRGETYSLTAYLVILFIVVIALVLLSYFVNARDSGQLLDDFSQRHNDRVTQLEERIDDLEERVSELEKIIADYPAIDN